MRAVAIPCLLAAVAQAHYTFPHLVYQNVTEPAWRYVRHTANEWSLEPVVDVDDAQMRCYEDQPGAGAPGTKAVRAGDAVGFRVQWSLEHPGPLAFYMARAPAGQTAQAFAGDGDVWFKIWQDGPLFSGQGDVTWPSENKYAVAVEVPACLPDGYYLLRVESIALHNASHIGGAQFYISCAQLYVTGGTGTYQPAGVAIPGAYKATDPGIHVALYDPIITSYRNPGPEPITC